MAGSPGAVPERRSNAARLFGYDVFTSFALGPPPRGSRSYASDLARRLRERDFTVFFSEEEAPDSNSKGRKSDIFRLRRLDGWTSVTVAG